LELYPITDGTTKQRARGRGGKEKEMKERGDRESG
jgi:hypothetical protein